MAALLAADVTLPPGALIPVIILGIVEVALVGFCIIDIVRRPAVLGDRKWLWIVLVILFALPGSIIYLAIGRVAAPVAEARDDADADARPRADAAADALYAPAAAAAQRRPRPPRGGKASRRGRHHHGPHQGLQQGARARRRRPRRA